MVNHLDGLPTGLIDVGPDTWPTLAGKAAPKAVPSVVLTVTTSTPRVSARICLVLADALFCQKNYPLFLTDRELESFGVGVNGAMNRIAPLMGHFSGAIRANRAAHNPSFSR